MTHANGHLSRSVKRSPVVDAPTDRRKGSSSLSRNTDWFGASILPSYDPVLSQGHQQSPGAPGDVIMDEKLGEHFSRVAANAIGCDRLERPFEGHVSRAEHNSAIPSRSVRTGTQKLLVITPSANQTSSPRIRPLRATHLQPQTSQQSPPPRQQKQTSSSPQHQEIHQMNHSSLSKQQSTCRRSGTSSCTRRYSRMNNSRPISLHVSQQRNSTDSPESDPPNRLKPSPSCPGIIDPIISPNIKPPASTGGAQSYGLSKDRSTSNTTTSTTNTSTSNTQNLLGMYRVQETIGVGNFSQVKLATHILTNELVAIKVLDKVKMDASTRRILIRELSILECLHHPNVVRLYEVMETFTRLHLVMEYVAGGDLNARIMRYGRFSESESKIVFAQLIAAVNHLHERNIFHRDIKADNILFTHRLNHLPKQQSAHNLSARANQSQTCRRAETPSPKGYKRHFKKLFRGRGRGVRDHKRASSSEANRGRNPTPTLKEIAMANRKLRGESWSQVNGGKLAGNDHQLPGMNGNKNDSTKDDDPLYLDYYRIKLADFGFSKLTVTSDQPLTTFCGSPAYAAPELFEAKSYRGGPVDMWALGIVLFFLLTGLLPYRGSTVCHVRRLVLEDRGLHPPDWLSPAATNLYQRLTARSPEDRPTSAYLLRSASSRFSNGASELGSEAEHVSRIVVETWNTWLIGQTFPKSLPRFDRCAPLIRSIRHSPSENADKVITPITTEISLSPLRRHLSELNMPDGCSLLESSDGTQFTGSSSSQRGSSKANSLNMMKPEVAAAAAAAIENEAEMEAARQLLNLGVTREEIAAARNMESRSAVTGAYRIILHRVHRARRMSQLDGHQYPLNSRLKSTPLTPCPDTESIGDASVKSEITMPRPVRKQNPRDLKSTHSSRLCSLL